MTPTERAAIMFFQEHAGYSAPPGRMVCARDLARAEREAYERNLVVLWQSDDDCFCDADDVKCRCDVERSKMEAGKQRYAECFCQRAAVFPGDEWGILEDSHPIVSLSGICDPSREYQRVVAAELCWEVLAPEWADLARYDALLARVAS